MANYGTTNRSSYVSLSPPSAIFPFSITTTLEPGPIRTFEHGAHILEAIRCGMRASLLLMYCTYSCCYVVCALLIGGLCVIHSGRAPSKPSPHLKRNLRNQNKRQNNAMTTTFGRKTRTKRVFSLQFWRYFRYRKTPFRNCLFRSNKLPKNHAF